MSQLCLWVAWARWSWSLSRATESKLSLYIRCHEVMYVNMVGAVIIIHVKSKLWVVTDLNSRCPTSVRRADQGPAQEQRTLGSPGEDGCKWRWSSAEWHHQSLSAWSLAVNIHAPPQYSQAVGIEVQNFRCFIEIELILFSPLCLVLHYTDCSEACLPNQKVIFANVENTFTLRSRCAILQPCK